MKRKIGIIIFIIAVIFITPRISFAFGPNANTGGSFGEGGGRLTLLAPTATLSVSPTSITYGAKATVTWSSTHASFCTSTGPWSNLAKTSGTAQTNVITANSTLTLQCTNSRGKKSPLKTVNITMKSATATLTASPTSIASGARSLLSWSSTGATSCTATGPWSNQGTLSGSGLTNALTSNTKFTFQCTGPGGTTPVKSVTIGVGQPAVASFKPKYSNIFVTMGVCSAYGYQSGNSAYASCRVSGNPLQAIGSGGSLSANITNNGATLSNVSVTCVKYYTGAEPQCTGSKVVSVGGTQFNMRVNGVGELRGDGGGAGIGGSVSPILVNGVCSATHYTCTKGTSVGNTNGPLKYSWSCTGSGGGTTAYCSETKPLVAPTATLTASSPIAYGARSTLSWKSKNATSCTTSGNWSNSGKLSGNGLTNALTSNATFTFQCTGPGGTTPVQSATVNVGKATINGVCATTHYTCTSGASTSNVSRSASWTWACTGSNGGSAATCSETKSACTLPWGGTTPSGTSVTTYRTSSVTSPATCISSYQSKIRTCTNGVLSVGYTYPRCSVTAPTPPPPPTGTLLVYPKRVAGGVPTSIKFSWTLNHVKRGSDTCQITKHPVGARTSFGMHISGNMPLPSKRGPAKNTNIISDTINTQTKYYIECNGKEAGNSVIVNVVPTFTNF